MHKPELSTEEGRTAIRLIVGSALLVIAVVTLAADLSTTERNGIVLLVVVTSAATRAVLKRHEIGAKQKV